MDTYIDLTETATVMFAALVSTSVAECNFDLALVISCVVVPGVPHRGVQGLGEEDQLGPSEVQ